MEVPFSARFHFARSGRNPDGRLVEGLRANYGFQVMPPSGVPFEHVPVLREEVLRLLSSVPRGVLLDATVGGGGHTAALLESAPQLEAVCLDRDPRAVEASRAALANFGSRAVVVQARFDHLDEVLDALGVAELSAALFDLGVSSPQFDDPERGFSYRSDAHLDMRMDPESPLSAREVVNGWGEVELARLFAAHGETRFARRIARAVVAARPITSTVQLAETVRAAIPAAARRSGGHPAKRVFQALRVVVNEELDVLPVAIKAALERLGSGGRAAVISYHSGEDRIVKALFKEAATGGCKCPATMPCVCGAVPSVKVVTRRAVVASESEVQANRRARSARLRVVEKIVARPSEDGIA